MRLQNQIKRMPREVKGWPVYKQRLEGEVRNMGIVIPLVAELKTDAMQDRHWKSVLALSMSSVVMKINRDIGALRHRRRSLS